MIQIHQGILKELRQTLDIIQRPKIVLHQPVIPQETSQQELLREIDFFCQKLTTVKKKQRPQILVETEDFQVQKVPSPPKEIAKQPSPQETPEKNVPVKHKLIIKKLQFQDAPPSWIPIKAQKKLENCGNKIYLNLCIFLPEEELVNIQFTQLNILTLIDELKIINIEDYTYTYIQFLKQLKIYTIVICLEQVRNLREIYLRYAKTKLGLADSHERQKKMLQQDLQRIVKKIYIRFLHLRTKYMSIISKMITQVNSQKHSQLINKSFTAFKQYCARAKEERYFIDSVKQHIQVQKGAMIFRTWRLHTKQQRKLKMLLIKNAFKQWQIQIRHDQNSAQKNKIITQFLTEEKDNDTFRRSASPLNRKTTEMQYSPDQSRQLQLHNNNESPKTNVNQKLSIQELQQLINNLKRQNQFTKSLIQKSFNKWRIAYLKMKIIEEFQRKSQIRGKQRCLHVFNIHSKHYDRRLKQKVFDQLKLVIQHKQQKLFILKQVKFEEQMKQVEQMASEVYQMNLMKRALSAWKLQIEIKQKSIFNSLKSQQREQNKMLHYLKCEKLIELKQKQKFLEKWKHIFTMSQESIHNLQDCEQIAKEKVYEQLIRVAFESSMKTQFRWLEYYNN